MNYIRKYCFLCFLLLAGAKHAGAQHLMFTGEIGGGLAYVMKQHLPNTDYKPAVTPNISVSILVPVSKKIMLESGLEYAGKGFKSDSYLTDADNPDNASRVVATAKRSYLNIPLVLSYRIWHTSKHQMFVGAGMNFGFLLRATVDGVWESYNRNELFDANPVQFSERIGLVQSYDKNGYDKIDLYLFDAGLKFQMRYVCANRYTIRLFHQMNLNDPSAKTLGASDGKTKQQYTGISVGIIFPRVKN